MILQPYKHDCEQCIWVSWIHIKGGGKFGGDWGNMYYCPPKPGGIGSGKHGSILIRFSDEPSDYWSSPIGMCVKGALDVGDE